MKRYFLMLAVFGLLCVPVSSFASVDDGTKIPAEVLRPLAKWVEKNSGMRMKSLPLAVASRTILKTSLGLEGVQQARSVAAYLPGRIIVNSSNYDEESIVSKSYLVHEMVHHAQLLNRKKYPCHEAKEKEAYILQNRYLEEHGEDPIYSQRWIDEIARCRG